MAKKLLHSFS
jgi:C1A family cysteine protease